MLFGGAGNFTPARRAFERPIAIACLRDLTLPPDPLFSVPRLNSCIVRSIFSDVFFPYLCAMLVSLSFTRIVFGGTWTWPYPKPPKK